MLSLCGIIAYKGFRDAGEVVIRGLKKLEYRGYDSWGLAAKTPSGFFVVKKKGMVSDAEEAKTHHRICIGHTRWATHGGVTEQNAHPHLDCDGRIAVVHNGIIDNYQELKKELAGHDFRSETDTEVIPHLVEENMKSGLRFVDAVKKAASVLEGRYAVVALDRDSDVVVAVRKGSPLIAGVGENEFFLASDIPAFLEYTNRVMYIDDGEAVVLGNAMKFFSMETGQEIAKRIIRIDWSAEQAEKNGYKHFLIKEIMEQKDTLKAAVNQEDDRIMRIADEIKRAYGTYFIGCGTAGKVAHTGEYLFSRIANRHVNFAVASEFPNYHHFLTDRSLVVAISQSGETADVLEAIEVAKSKNAKVISLLNVFGSSMMRASHDSIMVNAGVEKAVVSTKATTAQLAVMTLLAYAAAGRLSEGKKLLASATAQINDMLNPRYETHIRKIAEKIRSSEHLYIIGRSLNYPMALEAAIKIHEVSYIHAEGFAGGELKHGPIALISKGTPCIALVANDETKKDVISNAVEVKSRGAFIIGISPENNEAFDCWIKVPDAGNASPIVNIIPVQILAYHLAVCRGCDPDRPRNLAKSVTVK